MRTILQRRRTFLCLLLWVFTIGAQAQETRPPQNTGTGFFVKNGKIYDPTGVEFVPMGCNSSVYWAGNGECKKFNLSNNIPAAGANAVRIVSQTNGAFGWNANPVEQRDLVDRAVQAEIVPMLEMHDATCDANAFQTIVTYWRSAAMVQLCQDYEQYMWVNIANEHNFSTFEQWRDNYITAIQQIRSSGIKNLIVVDGGMNCGQNPQMIMQYAQQVLNADPQRNVVFSVHMYQYWRTNDKTFTGWTPPYRVEVDLPALKNAGIPVIVGEFGWGGGSVNYNAQTLINVCNQNKIGWYFWAWYDGPTVPHYGILTDVCATDINNRTAAGNFIIPYWQSNAVTAPVFASNPADVLNPTPTSLSFTDAAGSQTISLQSNLSWTVSDNASWITLSTASGSGNGSVNVTVSQNTTGSGRVGTVTFTGGVLTKTVIVNQSAALPAPWQSGDIGNPGVAGITSYSGGSFTVAGSGADIWGTSDQFRYVYQSLNGDGEISARVVSQTNSNEWAKAGVMIRASLSAGSANVATLVTPVNGLSFQRRTTNGGTSLHTAGAASAAPVWVRVVREGNVFTSYSSANGTTWTQIGSETITMGASVFVGLCVSAHNNTQTSTVVFSNVTADTGTPDTTPPSIPAGLASSNITNTSFTLSWSASTDDSGVVAGYDVYRDGVLAGSTATTSLAIAGLTANTTYAMTVRAKDAANNVSNPSAALNVTTTNTTPPPTFTIQCEESTSNNGGGPDSSQPGYIGSGYFDMGGNGSWVEYAFVPPGGAGTYQLDIRYANGSGANRACNVLVNGVATPNNFTATGSWTTWINSQMTITLTGATNTLRIQATTAAGGPNLDQLVFTGGGSTPTLDVSTNTITSGPSLGTFPIDITCNGAWTVVDNSTWISVSPASGTGNGTVTVTLLGNPSTSPRDGIVVVTSESLNETITVNQAGTTPPQDLIYEGEALTSQTGGSVRTDFGTTFFDFGGNSSFLEWNNVNVTTSGTYTLTFRYGNGSGANRQCALMVNSVGQGNVPFANNGDWAVWQTSPSYQVTLNAGPNTIRLTANTASGGPNFDYMRVVSGGAGGGARVAPAGVLPEQEEGAGAISFYPNPVRDYLTIRGIKSPTQVGISNLNGQVIRKVTTENGQLDVSDLSKGFYLLRVHSRVLKLIKE